MPPPLIKATTLKTPEGVEFVAFFDFDGLLPSDNAAQCFLDSVTMLTRTPFTVSFRIGANWYSKGTREDCSEFIVSHFQDFENRASLLLFEPVLTIPEAWGIGAECLTVKYLTGFPVMKDFLIVFFAFTPTAPSQARDARHASPWPAVRPDGTGEGATQRKSPPGLATPSGRAMDRPGGRRTRGTVTAPDPRRNCTIMRDSPFYIQSTYNFRLSRLPKQPFNPLFTSISSIWCRWWD